MVDGYLNFDTKVDTKGFDKGATQIAKKASKLGSTFGGAMSTAIGFGVAQLATKVSQSLINVANQAIELASDMDEVQNVVDTAFGDMAYKCEEFADVAIEQFGMSKLSAKQTASTYMSMAKAMGLSMESASDMAIETAKLTGDVASFYNISTDLASTKLKSIFTGETETLKDLGVVMTEANLKQYALANGYKTAYKDMSQAEKVALRYNFVMDALSDAQGDFAKTSGSWANQTRILQERWKELLSIMGSGLIRIFTPVIQVINQVMSALINLANVFANTIGKLFGFNKEVEASTKSATAAAGAESDLAEETEEAGKAAKKSLASFDELNILQSNTSSSSGDSGSSGVDLSFKEVETRETHTSVFDKMSKSLQVLQPYVDRLKDSWNNLKAAFERFTNSKGVQAVLVFLKTLAVYLANTLGASLLTMWAGALEGWAGILDIIGGLLTWVVGILTGDFSTAADGTKQMILGLKEVLHGLGTMLEAVLIAVLGMDCIEAIKKCLNALKNWALNSETSTKTVQKILKGLLQFVTGVFTLNWKKAWTGVKNIFKGIWNTIVSIAQSAINLMIRAINWIIDKLNRIKIKVPDWVTDLTGMDDIGFKISKISEVKLPKLASGAVIPPNAEFAAILGDQKNGRNLEAPESLLRQIVREESGNISAEQFEEMMYAALIRAADKTSPTIILEGDSDKIFKLVQKKATDYTYRTGKLAF